MFTKKTYQLLAKMLGEAQNMYDFQESLIMYLRNERSEFNEARFRKAVQKAMDQANAERSRVNELIQAQTKAPLGKDASGNPETPSWL